jgi:hypothetical protein
VSVARSRKNLTTRRLSSSTVPVASRPNPDSIETRASLCSFYTHDIGSSRSGTGGSGAAPVPGVGSGVWDVVSVFPVGPVCLFGGGAMTSSLKERFLDFAAHG